MNMDRRGFIRHGAVLAAAVVAAPSLAHAAESSLTNASAGSTVVTHPEASSVIEGDLVRYNGRPLVFFMETSGKGQNRVRRIGARNLHGREASALRMEELVDEFEIVFKTQGGAIKSVKGKKGSFVVADDTINAQWVDVYVRAPGEDKWFQAVTTGKSA